VLAPTSKMKNGIVFRKRRGGFMDGSARSGLRDMRGPSPCFGAATRVRRHCVWRTARAIEPAKGRKAGLNIIVNAWCGSLQLVMLQSMP
jgi:hypothetical protein